MTIELKPCPAGHGNPRICEELLTRSRHGFGVTCRTKNCAWEVAPIYDDIDTAAEVWNARAEPEVIETGYMIVDENSPVVCYGVHNTINEAWEDFQGGCDNCREESLEDIKKRAEQAGYRAVRVKIVKAE